MADQNTDQNSGLTPGVIDLRDSGSARATPGSATSSGAPAGGSTTTSAQQTAASASGIPVTKVGAPPKKSKSFSLEDEAMAAASQMTAPPDKFQVPTLVKEKFPDLVQLIKETESMNDEERDYWFQILPIMSEEQIRKFRTILVNEKEQLKALDSEYEKELSKLNEKHMIEWKEFESKEKRKKIQVAEQKSKEEERKAEEELLQRLSADS